MWQQKVIQIPGMCAYMCIFKDMSVSVWQHKSIKKKKFPCLIFGVADAGPQEVLAF